MEVSRLRGGLETLDITLTAQQEERLFFFLREMLRWNKKVNLTSVTNEEEAVEKHLIDSLTLLPWLGGTESLLDIGSGGGFPSLPLKIVRPDIEVVSVDAVRKKILFQRHVARLLSMEGFRAVHGRAEDLSATEPLSRHFSLITSRALSDIETFLAWAKPFARPDCRFIAMRGREAEAELERSRTAIERQGMRLRETIRIRLPFSGSIRHLLIFSGI